VEDAEIKRNVSALLHWLQRQNLEPVDAIAVMGVTMTALIAADARSEEMIENVVKILRESVAETAKNFANHKH